MLMQERLENARSRVLDEFPEAKPFADLIIAETPEDMREMARLIAERAKAAGFGGSPAPVTSQDDTEATSTPDASASGEAPTQEAPEPPVVGGGTTFSGEASADERVKDAIKAGDFKGFLAAKWEQKALADGDALAL